jgi:cell division protein FtsI/penicillin-binding protein 2
MKKPAVDGENIVLSIDRNVQSHADQALAAGLKRTGATHGSAIVMDPQTGKIVAMANLPTYSPAEFNKVEDAGLFNNPIVSVPYEPASVIKTLTLSTGIEKGVIGLNSTYVNTDSIKVDDRVISNATKGQTGTITFQHGLTYSLNTSTVTIAQRLGDGQNVTRQARDTMYDYFVNKFGMGQYTGVEVSGEAAGTVVSPEDEEGNAVRYSNMSFGQGMNVTMVQVASAFCSIINGGRYYKPTVIAGKVDSSGAYIPNQNPEPTRTTISASTSEQMRIATVTARALFDAKYDLKGYTIGGKTGSSQVIENGEYSADESIGSYVGFGGDDTPRYVIMIQLSGKNKILQGERDAMPVFTDISNWLLNYYKIQPKL